MKKCLATRFTVYQSHRAEKLLPQLPTMNIITGTAPGTITRRVFIKRSSSTALACAVAMSLLQSQANAKDYEDDKHCSTANLDCYWKQVPKEKPLSSDTRQQCNGVGVNGDCTLVSKKACLPANEVGNAQGPTAAGLFCVPGFLKRN